MPHAHESLALHAVRRVAAAQVCAPIAGEICDRLRLPPMVEQNTEKHATAFTVSIDYRVGTTTGISAHDRAATIAALCDARTRPEARAASPSAQPVAFPHRKG
jgi:3,4-dihydroxy-2-butanone 4-phosphate synthase